MRACVLAILLASGPALADVSAPPSSDRGAPIRCDLHSWEQAPFFRVRRSGVKEPSVRDGIPIDDAAGRRVATLRLPGSGTVLFVGPNGRDYASFDKGWARWDDAVSTAVRGDLILVAHFSHYATGSGLFAFDRATHTLRWEANVEQLRVAHSEYFNDVTLALDGNTVVLTGLEAGGCTVQRFEVATGKRLSSWVKRLW